VPPPKSTTSDALPEDSGQIQYNNVGSAIKTRTMQMLRAAYGKWYLLKNSKVDS